MSFMRTRGRTLMSLRCLALISCLQMRATALGDAAVLDSEVVEAYSRRGFAITRGALQPSEVTAVAARLRPLLLDHGRRAFGTEDGQKEVRFTFAVHELDAKVADFVTNRVGDLWRVAAQLAGTQDLCVLMDRGFSKDPGDPETHWHRDDEAIGLPAQHPALRTVHAWIPLAAMGRDMGTLQYLEGTHRRSQGWIAWALACLWGWDFAWFATSPIVQDDALQLGDVAWHDGWVLHSAGANSAGAVRDGLAVSFAYCLNASEGCSAAAYPMSSSDVTCRVAKRLFDERWKENHRNGENDYAKTEIQESGVFKAARFALRSIVGACTGLAVQYLLASRCGTRREDKSAKRSD